MAGCEGLEPPGPFEPTRFKRAAIAALPTPQDSEHQNKRGGRLKVRLPTPWSVILSASHKVFHFPHGSFDHRCAFPDVSQTGAGNGTRTRDLLLGKQMLYQLSYPRMGFSGALPFGTSNLSIRKA